MIFRYLLLMGFGAGLTLSAHAVAAPLFVPSGDEVVATDASQADVVPVAAKGDEQPVKKKPKTASNTKAKKQELTAKEKAEQARKLAAKKKEQEAQKLAARKAKEAKAIELAKAKAEKERKLAEEKEAKERAIAKAKAAEAKKIARAKAEKEREIARLKAAEDRKLAAELRAKAAEEKRLAKARAEQARRLAAEKAEQQRRDAEAARKREELVQLASSEIAKSGNNGELRSENLVQARPQSTGLFANLFGGQMNHVQQSAMLPETRALDAALALKEEKKKFKVRPEFEPQTVSFTGYPRDTIVVDTANHYLYLVESSFKARRYAIAVGKDGLQYKGTVKVGDKQEWPRWIPTKDMQAREPAKYGKYKDGMPGGGENPLGARAIYLHENGKDTHLRIHGTIAPETIGTNSSNGCFRMINEHVMDLYKRVKVGTTVIVL